jgi:hypothetical protein
MTQPLLYQSSCPAPQGDGAELGHFDRAEAHLATLHHRLSNAISRLNEVADNAFGAQPAAGETATKHGASAGAWGKVLQQISDLETALPVLETAIDRFAALT